MTWLQKVTKALNSKFNMNIAEDASEAEVVNAVESLESTEDAQANANSIASLEIRFTELESKFKESENDEDANTGITEESMQAAIAAAVKANSEMMEGKFKAFQTKMAEELNKVKSSKSVGTSSKADGGIGPDAKEDGGEGVDAITVNMNEIFSNTTVIPGLGISL